MRLKRNFIQHRNTENCTKINNIEEARELIQIKLRLTRFIPNLMSDKGNIEISILYFDLMSTTFGNYLDPTPNDPRAARIVDAAQLVALYPVSLVLRFLANHAKGLPQQLAQQHPVKLKQLISE
jgi:hypothetical protein